MSTAQSLTALQPFLLLAKSAKGRAAADLVLQATQAPDAYVFSELLTHPNIAALNESDDGKPYYRLLEIFAYGTWGDYQGVCVCVCVCEPPMRPFAVDQLWADRTSSFWLSPGIHITSCDAD